MILITYISLHWSTFRTESIDKFNFDAHYSLGLAQILQIVSAPTPGFDFVLWILSLFFGGAWASLFCCLSCPIISRFDDVLLELRFHLRSASHAVTPLRDKKIPLKSNDFGFKNKEKERKKRRPCLLPRQFRPRNRETRRSRDFETRPFVHVHATVAKKKYVGSSSNRNNNKWCYLSSDRS